MRPYFDPEYENYNQRMNPPRVCIDNTTLDEATLVKVDSMNRTGVLLEVVQVLSDHDLTILKAYITSDGGWFMDVFHVVDQKGQKVTDRKTIESIEKALGPESVGAASVPSPKALGAHTVGDYTAIELTGRDRAGLLSEIFAVLADLGCNVIAAEAWTHRRRVACVVYFNDAATGKAVADAARLSRAEQQLRNVLDADGDDARTSIISVGATLHVDRRLHQLMLDDAAGFDTTDDGGDSAEKPVIKIELLQDKDYSVVSVRCRDRPKLLFDIVCTLTDLNCVVFHASVTSEGAFGVQELYIRRSDGRTLEKAEAERAARCLEAAVARRTSEGFGLELCARDKVGLLSSVTRVFREHGLTVARAGVSTVGETAVNVFYVRDASGRPVDMATVDALRREIGQTVMLNVKNAPPVSPPAAAPAAGSLGRSNLFSFGNLFGILRG